ncbi:MAG TPA: hypothetical protein VN939_16585 [Chthoniobacterales bacterium]|jgi:hypothetical protein|nr:hypothetical protein [Chthoniobacterales bacterium]
MKFLTAVLAVILAATPVLAQSGGGDAAATGLAGLISMFGLFGFLVALVYSVLLFLLPFIVWKCLRRLTSIRDEIRGFREELAAQQTPQAGRADSWYKGSLREKEGTAPGGFTFENPE